MAIDLKDFSDLITNTMVVGGAITIRVLLHYIKTGVLHRAHIALYYVSGSLAGYIAYKIIPESDFKILYISVIVLLSRDIIEWLISKEGFIKIKDLLLNTFK